MKLVDVKARNQKELDKILKQIKAFIKEKKIAIGEITTHIEGLEYSITVESNNSGMKYGLGTDMEDIIRKSQLATVLKVEEFPGSFDWTSDTYIKDSSAVTFKF